MLVPLVVIHELGHFLMAKLVGIHVTEFSFGFGRKLFGFTYKGTEYRWNLLPLGGYVNLMGTAMYTGKVPNDPSHFYNKSKWSRFLVMLMGPAFNIFLAFGIFWAYYGMNPLLEPVWEGEVFTVGHVNPESPEAAAGLQRDDRILEINGSKVESMDQVNRLLGTNPGVEMNMLVARGSEQVTVRYTVGEHETEGVGLIQFDPKRRMMVFGVAEDTPAAAAGLQEGDIITHINDVPINGVFRDQNPIAAQIKSKAPEASQFRILRDGTPLELSIAPKLYEDEVYRIGVTTSGESRRIDLGPVESFKEAANQVVNLSTWILVGIRQLVKGVLSIRTLSSPIGVAQYAEESLDLGFWEFLWRMALLSLNLGILNLIPIPVLDGGEIFVLLVEGISRKNFDIETKTKIKMVGFFFLIFLMGAVILSDILKIFGI